jgi:hypothetical protein
MKPSWPDAEGDQRRTATSDPVPAVVGIAIIGATAGDLWDAAVDRGMVSEPPDARASSATPCRGRSANRPHCHDAVAARVAIDRERRKRGRLGRVRRDVEEDRGAAGHNAAMRSTSPVRSSPRSLTISGRDRPSGELSAEVRYGAGAEL